MDPEPKTLFGPFLLWIFTLGGAAVMAKGVLWAVYADFSVDRSGNDPADLGVLRSSDARTSAGLNATSAACPGDRTQCGKSRTHCNTRGKNRASVIGGS